jgi:4'-phosphopantetheinyl transferase
MDDSLAEAVVVDVVRVALSLSDDAHADSPVEQIPGWDLLSADEVERALRYRHPRPRRQFVTCRAVLRRLLSQRLAIPPRHIHFEYGPHGKPALPIQSATGAADSFPSSAMAATQMVESPDKRSQPEWLFNVSHSADVGVIAIAPRCPALHSLGVDVEQITPRMRWLGLAERFFSAQEAAALKRLPESLQLTGFYRVWTGKEAFVKSAGAGLSFSLQDFALQADPREPPAVQWVRGDDFAAQRWSVHHIAVPAGYIACLVCDGSVDVVRVRDWTWPAS